MMMASCEGAEKTKKKLYLVCSAIVDHSALLEMAEVIHCIARGISSLGFPRFSLSSPDLKVREAMRRTRRQHHDIEL
jgi:hypothetical protein